MKWAIHIINVLYNNIESDNINIDFTNGYDPQCGDDSFLE